MSFETYLSVDTSWDVKIGTDDDLLRRKAYQVYRSLTCTELVSKIPDVGGNTPATFTRVLEEWKS